MELKQLGYFMTVVDAGSFSRAAVVLNMAQPTLSRQVALLEEEFGQRLLIRTGRGVTLTKAGLLLADRARGLLTAAKQMTTELRDHDQSPSGRVTIGIPPRLAYLFGSSLVTRFRAIFPNAVLTLIEGLSVSLRELLTSGRLDMALLFDAPRTSQIELRELWREPLMVIGPPGTALPSRSGIADLSALPLVLPSAPNAIREQVNAALALSQRQLTIVAEVGAVQTTLALVSAGVGHTILPRTALAIAPEGMRFATSPLHPVIWNTLYLALPQNLPSTRLVAATISLIEALSHEQVSEQVSNVKSRKKSLSAPQGSDR
jgi:LysR family transcriptional regulator, nitrogen assimilation regulatory protein